jgi:hypothetical protein
VSSLKMSEPLRQSGTEDGQLTLWDVRSAAPLGTVRPTKKPILHAAVSPLRDCMSIITPEALRCVPLTTDGMFQVSTTESDERKTNHAFREVNCGWDELFICCSTSLTRHEFSVLRRLPRAARWRRVRCSTACGIPRRASSTRQRRTALSPSSGTNPTTSNTSTQND